MQVLVALQAYVGEEAGAGHAEIVVVALRYPLGRGVQAETVRQFDVVLPAKDKPRMVQRDGGAIGGGRLIILHLSRNRPHRMPLADDGASGELDIDRVVVLLAVDRTHEADERVFRTGEGFRGHRDGIFHAAIVQRQIGPLIGGIEHEAVRISRQQIGIAALIGVTIDVDRRTGQVVPTLPL